MQTWKCCGSLVTDRCVSSHDMVRRTEVWSAEACPNRSVGTCLKGSRFPESSIRLAHPRRQNSVERFANGLSSSEAHASLAVMHRSATELSSVPQVICYLAAVAAVLYR